MIQQSHDILQALFNRMERSDRGQFQELQLLGRLHRKLGMIYLTLQNYPLAEHHFAEVCLLFSLHPSLLHSQELSMMLLDDDFRARGGAREQIENHKSSFPQFASSATVKESESLLNRGIAAFNKGPTQYDQAAELLALSVLKSRLCGSEMVLSL
jgi:hypothetical protein